MTSGGIMPSHARALATWRLVERAWIAVCFEVVGPEGHVVPQHWLTHTSAPNTVCASIVVYGASQQGLALCCDATLVSPITRGRAAPRAEQTAGVALQAAGAVVGGDRSCASYLLKSGAGGVGMRMNPSVSALSGLSQTGKKNLYAWGNFGG